MKFKIKLLIFIPALLLIVSTQFAYKEPLYDASLTAIEDMQANSSEQDRRFIKIITDIFGPVILLVATGLILFNFGNILDSLYINFVFSVQIYLSSIMKIWYHQPRPYLSSDNIKAYSCARGFGNPSGHSFSIATVSITISLLILAALKRRKSKHLKVCTIILSTISLFLMFLVGFSRAYLGAHSFNQILYGWLWGIWLALFLYYVIYPEFLSYHKKLIRKQIQGLKYHLNAYVGLNILCFILVFTVGVISYFWVKDNFYIKDDWSYRMTQKCKSDQGGPYFSQKSFSDLGGTFLWIGSVLGFWLHLKLLGNRMSIITWNRTKFLWKGVLRIIVTIVILVLPGLLYLLIKLKDTQFWVYFVFRMCLTTTLIGILEFGVVRALSRCLKITNQQDQDQAIMQDDD